MKKSNFLILLGLLVSVKVSASPDLEYDKEKVKEAFTEISKLEALYYANPEKSLDELITLGELHELPLEEHYAAGIARTADYDIASIIFGFLTVVVGCAVLGLVVWLIVWLSFIAAFW
jgi:hypothetical protein